MSLFSNVISWFAHSSALSGAKQEAVQAITDAATKLVQAAQTHAPDMASQVEAAVTQAVSHAVAGILTKSS